MNSNNNDNNDNHLFRAFVNDVTPLKKQTIEPTQNKPKARVKKHVSVISNNSNNTLNKQQDSDSFFAFHISKKARKNFKAGNVYFEATLDLHGHTVAQSERLMSQFINDCRHQKIQHAIIVHGQGHNSEYKSVLKPAVLYWLSQQEAIDAYCSAQQRDGGKGASYIMLGI